MLWNNVFDAIWLSSGGNLSLYVMWKWMSFRSLESGLFIQYYTIYLLFCLRHSATFFHLLYIQLCMSWMRVPSTKHQCLGVSFTAYWIASWPWWTNNENQWNCETIFQIMYIMFRNKFNWGQHLTHGSMRVSFGGLENRRDCQYSHNNECFHTIGELT